MLSRICFVSLTGILEYILVTSRHANLEVGVIGVCISSCINCAVFLILKECGNGIRCWIFCVSSLANL